MVYTERNTWATIIAAGVTTVVYIVLIAGRLVTTPAAEIDWVTPMLWTMGISIAAAIVLSILWGILAGARDPDGVGATDQRDREISRHGNRIGYGGLVVVAVTALILCMFEVDWFWIGNMLFLGVALSTLAGEIARVIAYRRGLA